MKKFRRSIAAITVALTSWVAAAASDQPVNLPSGAAPTYTVAFNLNHEGSVNRRIFVVAEGSATPFRSAAIIPYVASISITPVVTKETADYMVGKSDDKTSCTAAPAGDHWIVTCEGLAEALIGDAGTVKVGIGPAPELQVIVQRTKLIRWVQAGDLRLPETETTVLFAKATLDADGRSVADDGTVMTASIVPADASFLARAVLPGTVSDPKMTTDLPAPQN